MLRNIYSWDTVDKQLKIQFSFSILHICITHTHTHIILLPILYADMMCFGVFGHLKGSSFVSNCYHLLYYPKKKFRTKIYKIITYHLRAGITQWCSAGLRSRWSGVRVPAGAGNFSLHHCVQTASGAHPTSYPVGTRGSFPGGKAAGAWS
jgi:hypothetical protein